MTDGSSPASAVLKDGNAVYTPGLSERRGSASKFYHADALGSTRGITNSSQTVTGTLTQDGFGNPVASTGSSANPYMYAATSGYRNDGDAGLSHVGARYYDAQVGRFITRDTFLDQKPYLYCNHDPVNCLDPSGHNFWKWLAKAFVSNSEAFGTGLSGGLVIAEGVVAVIDIMEAFKKRDEFRKKRNSKDPTAIALRPDDPGAGSDHRRSDPTRRVGPKPGDPSVRGGPEQETD